MITRNDVLQKWHREWCRLRAWCQDLSRVQLVISDECPVRLRGTCQQMLGRVTIYRHVPLPSIHIAMELSTLIHELAHAATIGDDHGIMWQGAYSRAILEVTGIAIPRAANNYRVLDRAGEDAVQAWWKSSGNDFLWRLAGARASG